ncbi:MAG: O-antigen ligase family protein [Anaerolineae bacterium]|nr:O-antigen ligase family protein [Anaerolineae bacterium]
MAPHTPRLGANVDWLTVDDAELGRQAEAARTADLTHVRQRLEWGNMEPTPGEYQWAASDRLVDAAQAHGLGLVLTLVGAPAWARSPEEQAAPLAPPADPATFARFVGVLVSRYRGRLLAVQLWDSPNLAARSHGEFIPARQYIALLQAAYPAAKAADSSVIVLGGGLAATTENSTRNQTDTQYLEWLYRAGARGLFDALAIKPYGFWSGPDDRRVSPTILNFSRAVLLRETMTRYGDGATPTWAVEWGWNTLPPDWAGRPSPWGTDSAETQADRTAGALTRARAEWPWLPTMTLMSLRPAAPPDDPVWGFTLLDAANQPGPVLRTVQAAAATPPPLPVRPSLPWPTLGLWLALVASAGLAGWQGARVAWRVPWGAAWHAWDTALARLGEGGNLALLAGVVSLVALLPSPLNLVPLAALPLLLARRLDLALAGIVLTAPFFLQPIRVVGGSLALVEILTVLTFGVWLARELIIAWTNCNPPSELFRTFDGHPGRSEGSAPRTAPEEMLRFAQQCAASLWVDSLLVGMGRTFLRRQLPLTALDVSVLLLLVLGAVSPFVALMNGVAAREFRVVILEPVLFYLVLRRARLGERELLRLVDALVLAGVGLALGGFLTYQGDGGIAAEGVRRLRSVYGSPNNLALALGRILPILLVFLVWGQSRWRRVGYGLALAPIVVALFLTFSTGAWLLGVPAALLFLGLVQGRRALVGALVVLAAGLVALLPFATTERVGRLARLGDAQTLEWRRSLWQSALNMIRDHPWFGVGLDNFLYEYREVYILPQALADRNLSHPHNLVLDFWTRLGVFAVVALVVGEAAFFRAAWRLWHRLSGDRRLLVLALSASMVNFLAHGLIDNSLFLVDLAFIYMLTVGVMRNLDGGL